MRSWIALFQTAEGSWHWPSIFSLLGWLAASAVLAGTLIVSRVERLQQGPWLLSEDEQKAFVTALKNERRGKVSIEYSSIDARRVYGFAEKLKQILEREGYEVWNYLSGFLEAGRPPQLGISIGVVKNAESDVVGGGIQRALSAAGIDAKGLIRIDNNYPVETAVIYVGAKP